MTKQPWETFASTYSRSFVSGLVTQALSIPPDQLVEMEWHRREDRTAACGGHDPIRIVLAYAQEEWGYDERDTLAPMNPSAYKALPRERRLNKFGLAYRRNAKFYLHRTLADIVVTAAIHLYQTQRWTTVLYDGLRTVEGAFNLYNFATDQDIESGLLALPGQSAHNKGLAVDSMMEDADGNEIDMGGHFDHLDMETNSRTYAGDKVSAAAKRNRLTREAAFLRGALTQGLLVAPLRNEFWDDRLPENRADLWRVLDSAARCLGIHVLAEEDEWARKNDRTAFRMKWEDWSYQDFLDRWREIFAGQDTRLKEIFGVTSPPEKEKAAFYHGNYHPLYDRDLKRSGKHLTALAAA